MVQGVYKAKLSDDGKTLTGTWTQGGGEPTTLAFARATATPATDTPAAAPPAQPTVPPK